MKRTIYRLIALCLAVSVLLGGCGVIDLQGYFDRLAANAGFATSFADMEYSRPDPDAIEAAQEACATMAADENTDFDDLAEKLDEFFVLYSAYSTAYCLSYIHYSIAMNDTYWETEYNYCADHTTAVDACRDQLLYALADSHFRKDLEHPDYFGDGFFDAFDGESVWTDTFTELMEQESALQNEYYRISSEALSVEYYSKAYFETYAPQLADLFVKMIRLRKQIAAEAGYADYPSFAYEFYHNRDYTVSDADGYLKDIEAHLVPLYRTVHTSNFWSQPLTPCTEDQTWQYVKTMSAAMGGMVHDAFKLMDGADLYHIAYGEHKYSGSFEIYLNDYAEPFVFVSPTGNQWDKLTFAHEFGHFCNDYASGGTAAGVDVAEFFSQGMEYLSLCYVPDSDSLLRQKMADSLSVFVEQAAYARFEHEVYKLSDAELTTQNVEALYKTICSPYGFDEVPAWNTMDYVTVDHFFVAPLYVISYVVSNDVAMQLYEMEQAKKGSGLSCYTAQLATEEFYFLTFVEKAGLKSPFAPKRIENVKATFTQILGK